MKVEDFGNFSTPANTLNYTVVPYMRVTSKKFESVLHDVRDKANYIYCGVQKKKNSSLEYV